MLGQDFPLTSVEQGHVHRVPVGGEQKGGIASILDPDTAVGDVLTGGGPRSISTYASGMQQRAGLFMYDNGVERKWGSVPGGATLEDMGGYGAKHTDPLGGEWTIKQPTMKEIEEGTKDWVNKKGQSMAIKYHDNFLANTIEDDLRLSRIERNLQFLADQKPELQNAGLFVSKETQPNWMVGSPADNGFQRVELPGMDGWADPKIAAILNDFYKGSGGELDNYLAKANRLLVQSLFVVPFRHQAQCRLDGIYWPGLGLAEAYSLITELARSGSRALRAVWTMNDDYVNYLREGSALQYGNVQTENFHHLMMQKLFKEQLADTKTWGDYVTSIMGPGYAVRDLVKAEYRWSRKTLWATGDFFALQRQFELEARGLSKREAIRQAEIDIPNYRVPSEVMGTRIGSLILKSPYVVFGPWQYGRAKMLSSMVKDLVQGADKERRWEALGKLTMLGALGVGGYAGGNYTLKKATGNPDATVANVGIYGPLRGIYDYATGKKDWSGMMGSLFDLGPILDVINELDTGKNRWGQSLVPGSGVSVPIEVGEAAAQHVYPVALALHALEKTDGWKRSLGTLFALNLPEPGLQKAIEGAKAKEASIDLGRVRRDILDQWVRMWLHDPVTAEAGAQT